MPPVGGTAGSLFRNFTDFRPLVENGLLISCLFSNRLISPWNRLQKGGRKRNCCENVWKCTFYLNFSPEVWRRQPAGRGHKNPLRHHDFANRYVYQLNNKNFFTFFTLKRIDKYVHMCYCVDNIVRFVH